MMPITGTPYSLAYASQRSDGYEVPYSLRIPATGRNSLPPSVEAVVLEVEIAGQKWTQRYAPQNNIIWNQTWDSTDAFSRQLTGATPVRYRRGYAYPTTYYQSSQEVEEAWGQLPQGTQFTAIRRRFSEIILWREEVSRFEELMLIRPTVGGLDNRNFGFGGWNVDVHHVYDPVRRTLYRGDGTQRISWTLGSVVDLAAGTDTSSDYSGDGGQAVAAELDSPGNVADDMLIDLSPYAPANHRA